MHFIKSEFNQFADEPSNAIYSLNNVCVCVCVSYVWFVIKLGKNLFVKNSNFKL